LCAAPLENVGSFTFSIGEHYGIGSSTIGAIHRRLADRPDTLHAVESLARQLSTKRTKYKA
jgi:hypothetical protein